MKPHEILSLSVTAIPQSLPWIQAMTKLQRAAQIEAALPPHLGVREAGFGDRIANNLELIEMHIRFSFKDLTQVAAAFERIGKELAFPPGTRLTHASRDAQGEWSFTNLLEW